MSTCRRDALGFARNFRDSNPRIPFRNISVGKPSAIRPSSLHGLLHDLDLEPVKVERDCAALVALEDFQLVLE
jgi:hypothetical protein